MAIPTSISDLDIVPGNNVPAGSESIGTNMDDYLRSHAAIIKQVSNAKADVGGGNASGSWPINAATVTNGVYTSGDQTIYGVKTFNSMVRHGHTQFSAYVGANADYDYGTVHGSTGKYAVCLLTKAGEFAGFLLQVDSVGNVVATGDVSIISDDRVKTNWRCLGEGFIYELAQVKSGIYDRTDKDMTQVGVSAQSLRNVIPDAVLEDSEGRFSVAYGNAALAACIELAKKAVALEARIVALEGKQ